MSTETYARRAIVACFVLVAAGCGDNAAGDDNGATQETKASQTRAVESDFGTVELPTRPERALGMYTTDIDILITLGIPLAKSQPIRGDGYTAFPSFFPQPELADIEPFHNYPEYNYEAILKAQPDLILNGLGYDEEVVKRLPEIAPTYSIDAFDGTDWRDKFKQIATALDRVDEYEGWVSSYEAKVADVREKLDRANIDPVVAPVMYSGNTVTVECYGVPCLVFKDLGLRISPLAEKKTELSIEELDQLSGLDVAFRSAKPAKDGTLTIGTEYEDLADNKLWSQLPFVANDEFYAFDMEMLYGSPSGHEAFLEVVEQSLLNQNP